jgi:hypothetical protein
MGLLCSVVRAITGKVQTPEETRAEAEDANSALSESERQIIRESAARGFRRAFLKRVIRLD